MQRNSKNKFLLVFAIVLCIFQLYTTAEIRTFTHFEENNDYDSIKPRMYRLKVYDDGTAVARIVRSNKNTTEPPKICFYDTFSLRIIYLNGTVDEKDIKLDIPQINYCFITQDGLPIRFLDYFLIRKDQILITYVNTTNPDDYTTYEDWGMIIDFDGNEYSRTFFALRFIDITTHQLVPGDSVPFITLNVKREKGFLRIYNVRGGILREWQQYKIESDGTFTKLTSGIALIYLDNLVGQLVSSRFTAISTVDEGYNILFGNTINNFTATNPLLPQAQLSVLLIEYNETATSPLIIYQTSLPNLIFTGLDCSITFVGVGQTCILAVSQEDPVGLAPSKLFFVKIDFLTSGSATSVTAFNNIAPSDLLLEWSVKSLQFGGFLLINVDVPSNSDPKRPHKNIYGYLFNGVDENTIARDLPEPVPGNTEGIYEILSNNTLLVPQFEDGNFWQFVAIDLPKFFGDKDKGYFNVNVNATFPAINEIISPNETYKISINFYNPVKLSNGKLSIYQVVGDQPYLRQSIPSIKCSIENDGKTVSTDVLESTFSISKGNYFIVVDNNLVVDTAYREPQLGIRENVWKFTTEEKKDIFAPDETGLLRLTSYGTQVFDNLSQDERHDFFDNLLEELSIAVPVDSERLTTNGMTQLDNSLNEKRYLISIGILATRDEYDNSVASIIKIIDTLIRNKDQSPIGLSRIAGYLDKSYGFKQLREHLCTNERDFMFNLYINSYFFLFNIIANLWEVYRSSLIGLFLIIGVVLILFIIAQRRYSEVAYSKFFLITLNLRIII